MRPIALLLLLVLLPAAQALPSPASPTPGPHSANVVMADHNPDAPSRGDSVLVVVELRDTSNVSRVTMIHCRVQAYACAPATAMARGAGNDYTARIPWNGDFFAGVTRVGYQFQIHYQDGSIEQSPVEHVPSRPADLPEGGSVYYYYALAEESPGASLLAVLLAVGLLAWRRKST